MSRGIASTPRQRVDGVFGEDGLVSISQISPSLSFQRPAVLLGVEGLILTLVFGLGFMAIYQAATLDEFPVSQRHNLILTVIVLILVDLSCTGAWVAFKMHSIARIGSFPYKRSDGEFDIALDGNGKNESGSEINRESSPQRECQRGGQIGAGAIYDESPERRSHNRAGITFLLLPTLPFTF